MNLSENSIISFLPGDLIWTQILMAGHINYYWTDANFNSEIECLLQMV